MLITISGFGTSSGSSPTPGVHKMQSNPAIGGKVKGPKLTFEHDNEVSIIVGSIETNLKSNPCQPVIIIGHSLGGSKAIKVADALLKKGICVDLLVQLESVGAFDGKTPTAGKNGPKVVNHVNLYDFGMTFMGGDENVEGATNIAINGAGHTGIDEGQGKAVGEEAKKSGLTGKNPLEIISFYIGKIPAIPCNCKVKSNLKTSENFKIDGNFEINKVVNRSF